MFINLSKKCSKEHPEILPNLTLIQKLISVGEQSNNQLNVSLLIFNLKRMFILLSYLILIIILNTLVTRYEYT